MKKMTMLKVFAVLMLALSAMPGCVFTSAQFTSWVAGDKGLASITIGNFWDTNVTPVFNPTKNPVTQSYLDLGKTVTQTLANDAISMQIPQDPFTIK